MANGSRRMKLLRGTGYAVFTIVLFLAFLWREFPYPDLGRYVETRAAAAGLTLEIDGLGPGPFPGVAARRVRFIPPSFSDIPLDFSDVSARVTPLAWLRGGPVARVESRFLGGTVEAQVPARHGGMAKVRWDVIDLARVPLPPEFSEMNLRGKASGNLSGRVPTQNPTTFQGTVEARFEGTGVGPGKAHGIPVPEVNLGTGLFQVEMVGQGKVTIKEARFEGGSLAATFTSGTILLRNPLTRSLINGLLSLAPDPKVEKDLALLFAVFPGAKGSDGRYTARVRGSFTAPRIVRR